MKWNVGTKISVGFAVTLAIFVIVGAVSYQSVTKQTEAAAWVAHTREVQNQLIALGFDPGPADGQTGPATVAAAQQYDQSRGGCGQVSIDSALLARLKADTAPRLTYDQVAARSQSRSRAQAPASTAN